MKISTIVFLQSDDDLTKKKNDRKFETKSLFVWDLNQTGSARRLPADENNFLETQNLRRLKWKFDEIEH